MRRHFGLVGRLLAPIVAAILVAGSIRTVLVFGEEIEYAQRQLKDKARFIETTVRIAASGKDAPQNDQLEEILAVLVAADNVFGAEWRQDGRVVIQSSRVSESAVPDWFVRLAALDLPQPVINLRPANAAAGQIVVTFDGRELLAKAWQRVRLQAITVLTVIGLLIGAIMLILRSSLRGLHNLSDVAAQIQQGQYYARAGIQGSADVRAVAIEFNRMIDTVAQEIVVRKSSEARLQQERATLAGILDAMEELVLLIDTQGRVGLVNPAVARWLDLRSSSTLVGQPVAAVLPLRQSDGVALDWEAVQRVVDATGHQPLDNLICEVRGNARGVEGSAVRLESETLAGMILVLRDVSEMKRLLLSAEWHATHDPLTGLPNRFLLSDRLSQACQAAVRQTSLVGVVFFDLDGFKPVNDVYGHRVGDQLLTECARRVEGCLRAMDTVVRVGGDEFVVLLTDLNDEKQIAAGVERILAVIAAPYELSGTRLKVTASLGVTVFPADDADPDTLLRHADQAMYAAKAAGRNTWTQYLAVEEQGAGPLLERLALALQQGELRLYYQPQVNMRTGNVAGLEALMRWQHPQRGLLSPVEFLPVAEKTPLIEQLGEWAVAQALADARRLHEQGLAIPVAVNIAGRHFLNPSFVCRLKAQLALFPDLRPSVLRLEITESSALADMSCAAAVVRECQALGVGVAIDDFGTGYASLSYLRQLPVDELKIDQHFVRDILDDKNDLALVEAIISLAKVFERHVLAEGVETPEQGVLLLRLGCDLVQGYGIARPMPVDAIGPWRQGWVPDPAWLRWANVRWSIVDFPLMMAQYDHLRWINHLLRHLDGRRLELGEDELNDHHRCRFGLWYDQAGKDRYGHLPEYVAIDAVHCEVHRLGRAVVDLLREGMPEHARQVYGQLVAHTDRILALLANLQEKINAEPEV